jgi:hypothetical protein
LPFALIAPEPREADCGTQFEAPRLLMLRNPNCGVERLFSKRSIRGIARQQYLPANTKHFGFVPALARVLDF